MRELKTDSWVQHSKSILPAFPPKDNTLEALGKKKKKKKIYEHAHTLIEQ